MNGETRLRFDEFVDGYDRWRPGYAPELLADVVRHARLGPDSTALEIGIGTGQATPAILATGCRVTAVEIGSRLADFTRKKFASAGNLEVVTASFEDFASPDGRFDLVYAATAFHWIPPETGLPKAFRLLKPGGGLALFRNHPFVARADDPVHRAIQRAYRGVFPDGPEPEETDESSCRPFEETLARFGFVDVGSRLYRRTRTLSSEAYLGLLETYSDHRSLPPEAKERLYGAISRAIRDAGDRLAVHDTMVLHLARRPV